MIKVYGIANCDTVKKANTWLEKNKLSYEFHDYRKEGITKDKLKEWCSKVGWENVLNKKSTTWKELTEGERSSVKSTASAIKLMIANPTMIKRPVIENEGEVLIGFKEDFYVASFKNQLPG